MKNVLILEGRNQDEALAILKRFSKKLEKNPDGTPKKDKDNKAIYKDLYNPEEVYAKLEKLDKSENNKNLPFICYYWANTLIDNKRIELPTLKDYFENYTKIVNRNKIKPLIYTREGIKMDNKILDWLHFTEEVDAKKAEAEASNVDMDEMGEIDKDLIYQDNRYTIYLADTMAKCIKYTDMVPILFGGGRPTFCIGSPAMHNSMWRSYRLSNEATFYFIFDKKPNYKGEEVVVFDVQKGGRFSLTARPNSTGYKSGETYLKENPVLQKLQQEKKIFKNIPLTEKERIKIDMYRNPVSDSYFIKEMNEKDRQEYLDVKHSLSDAQWNVLSPMLRLYYINLRMDLTPEQLKSLKPQELKRYKDIQRRKMLESIKAGKQLSSFQLEQVYEEDKELLKEYIVKNGQKIGELTKISCLVNTNTVYSIFKNEEMLYKPEFSSVEMYTRNEEGYIPNQIKVEVLGSNKSGIMDNNGEWLCSPDKNFSFKDKHIWFFHDYCAFHILNDSKKKCGILKKGGIIVVKPKYGYLSSPSIIDGVVKYDFSHNIDSMKDNNFKFNTGRVDINGNESEDDFFLD